MAALSRPQLCFQVAYNMHRAYLVIQRCLSEKCCGLDHCGTTPPFSGVVLVSAVRSLYCFLCVTARKLVRVALVCFVADQFIGSKLRSSTVYNTVLSECNLHICEKKLGQAPETRGRLYCGCNLLSKCKGGLEMLDVKHEPCNKTRSRHSQELGGFNKSLSVISECGAIKAFVAQFPHAILCGLVERACV